MPTVVPQRRTRDEDESDLDGSSPYEKRPRLDGDAESPLLPSSYRATQNGDSDDTPLLKYHVGSIVRVTMKNFVTYTAAEFLPGPSLNMVIGPNGTGKSTLVCAICLGLGSKPDVLGRAKDPSEFVKHGAREAEIEIELERDPDRHRTNPVIKRVIKRDAGSSKTIFFIDGRSSTQKAVAELCKSFSIQVDNLCQFLPQDRVVEFAALDPVDLLVQTQRAAAPDYMSDWHEQLKTMRADQRKAEADQQAMQDNLKNLESRQNLQRGDVERLRERAEIQERLAVLERLRPFPAYRVARSRFSEAKVKQNAAKAELNRLERENQPSLDAVKAKAGYERAIKQIMERRQRVAEKGKKDIKDKIQKQKAFEAKIQDCTKEIEAERKGVKDHKQERLRLAGTIKNLERQRDNEPPQVDAAAHNEKIREALRNMHDRDNAAQQLNDQQRGWVEKGQSLKQRIEHAKATITQLRSKAGQQTNKLNSASPDTGRAWAWVQDNKDKFSGPVFGPAMLECSVKDPKNASVVESVLQQADLTCFTMTNRDDFNMIQTQLINNMKLSDINLRLLEAPLSSWRRPVSEEQQKQLGLDAFILDLIDGPDEVLSMLCDSRNIHMYGVSFSDVSTEQFNALTQSPISSWATPSETYQITRRREYGDAGVSTRTTRIRPARFFTSQPVDTHAEQECKNMIAELTEELQEAQKKAEECRAESARLGAEHSEFKRSRDELDKEKKNMQNARSEWQKLPTKIAGLKTKIEGLDQSQANYRARVQAIKDKQDKLTFERAQEALWLAVSIRSLPKLETEWFHAQLAYQEARSDHAALKARSEDVERMLEEARVEVARLEQEKNELKQIAQDGLTECNEILSSMSDKEQDIYNGMGESTPEEFEVEIDSTRARLEMVHEGNPRILREYEERGQQIVRAQGKLENIAQQMEELKQNMAETRQKWEPELDELIGQISDAFSENFAKINCAGQVEVYKEEDDFNRWAIQIQVKFRENEELSVLDSHRQSGGERAVSTIFYLMALQSLARAPFRVVDEINQGMDPRNERMVHSRMVDIACSQHTSQYFLITPKLLPNLMYHPNMKVHCIASGEYMPEGQGKLDFSTLAQKALQLYGAGSAFA